jgi:hypothetical protein
MVIVSRNFYRIAPALILFILYQSCSSSFNPAAPYKSYTSVYGLLNLKDTTQYIKIERTYLSETSGNAFTEAQVADSIYYPAGILNASLEAFNNGTLVNTIPLHRINGDSIGLNKDTGVFVTNPNIVYYTKTPMNAAYSYELVINNNKTGQITTSQQVNLIDSFTITNPRPSDKIELTTSSTDYFTTSWFPSPNAELYQLIVRFYYSEINIANNSDSTVKYITWTFPTVTYFPGSITMTQSFQESFFYTLATAEIPVNSMVLRRALYFDFLIYAGGTQLYTYQLYSIANSTSLVEGVVNPYYTDISNGIGLFSSTYSEAENNLPAGGMTQDSLACSSITKQLNFLNSLGEPCPQ